MTEPARCAVCVNYTFKNADRPTIAAGLGHCALGPAYSYPNPYMPRNDCATFEIVKAADLPARLKWEGKQ